MKLKLLIIFLMGSLALSAQHTGPGNTVVILDSSTPYPSMLMSGIKPGARVVRLDPEVDPLTSIHQAIKLHEPVASLHIFSQGKPGRLIFSNGEIDRHRMSESEEVVGSWKLYFTVHGDILLYGCEVGKGHRGLEFIRNLAVMTGLDIAASDNFTGSVLKGGDWYFEIRSGRIESSLVISRRVVLSYPALLREGIDKKPREAL